MNTPKLYMVIIGCTPEGRNIEQHDIFFGVAPTIRDLVPEIVASWPEAKDKLHLDAYREVTKVDGYKVEVIEKTKNLQKQKGLFFLNLGGYKPDVFDELHYKMIVVADEKAQAIKQAKETAFYKHTGFKNAASHIDDKFGVDVDDIFEIKDILSEATKAKYTLKVTKSDDGLEDLINLGYFQLHKL